ncbi:MAG: hypothetical protein ACU0DK_16380 [Pseudooceanicola sp.]
MSELIVTRTRFLQGVWEGVVTGTEEGATPAIEVTLDQAPLEGVTLTPREDGSHVLRVPVPAEAIGDGIRTFVIRDTGDGATLDSFAILAGEAMADTMRAEIDLLREELDLLKRAFRRHCVETA